MFTEIDQNQPHNPQRLALAQYVLAMVNLLAVSGIEAGEMEAISVNYDGFSRRLDIAQLDESGHLDRIVLSLAADPNLPETFATSIGLPTQPGGQTH